MRGIRYNQASWYRAKPATHQEKKRRGELHRDIIWVRINEEVPEVVSPY
jgi:hypothetical protein